MSSGRTYTVNVRGVSVSAIQDFVSIYAGSGGASIEIVGHNIGPCNTTVEILQVSGKILPATVTTGSGGTSATPVADNRGDAAATATARINDTTQASSSGTVVYAYTDDLNEVNGLPFFYPENSRPKIQASQAFVLAIETTPGGARTMSGWVKFRELF